MVEEKHVIEPQRQGLWIAVAFIVALLALALAMVNMKRTTESALITQAEVLLLKQQMQELHPANTAGQSQAPK